MYGFLVILIKNPVDVHVGYLIYWDAVDLCHREHLILVVYVALKFDEFVIEVKMSIERKQAPISQLVTLDHKLLLFMFNNSDSCLFIVLDHELVPFLINNEEQSAPFSLTEPVS